MANPPAGPRVAPGRRTNAACGRRAGLHRCRRRHAEPVDEPLEVRGRVGLPVTVAVGRLAALDRDESVGGPVARHHARTLRHRPVVRILRLVVELIPAGRHGAEPVRVGSPCWQNA